jgi:hypothetical protein
MCSKNLNKIVFYYSLNEQSSLHQSQSDDTTSLYVYDGSLFSDSKLTQKMGSFVFHGMRITKTDDLRSSVSNRGLYKICNQEFHYLDMFTNSQDNRAAYQPGTTRIVAAVKNGGQKYTGYIYSLNNNKRRVTLKIENK